MSGSNGKMTRILFGDVVELVVGTSSEHGCAERYQITDFGFIGSAKILVYTAEIAGDVYHRMARCEFSQQPLAGCIQRKTPVADDDCALIVLLESIA